jgi:hypothetical protein
MMQFLNQNEAFSDGVPLWIIADLEGSRWAKKLDWYLNFQLRRASRHTSPQISESTKQSFADWGFSAPEIKAPTSSLMIASCKLLPNEWTVQIKLSEKWASECLKLMQDLRVFKARVFLPTDMTADHFKAALRELQAGAEMTFELVSEELLKAKSSGAL